MDDFITEYDSLLPHQRQATAALIFFLSSRLGTAHHGDDSGLKLVGQFIEFVGDDLSGRGTVGVNASGISETNQSH